MFLTFLLNDSDLLLNGFLILSHLLDHGNIFLLLSLVVIFFLLNLHQESSFGRFQLVLGSLVSHSDNLVQALNFLGVFLHKELSLDLLFIEQLFLLVHIKLQRFLLLLKSDQL